MPRWSSLKAARFAGCIGLLTLMDIHPAMADVATNHIVCSAYNATLAVVMAGLGQVDNADKMGDWAETHAAEAVASGGVLKPWAVRSMITDLTVKFKEIAKSQQGVMQLAEQNQARCVSLAEEWEKANSAKKVPQ